LALRNSANPLTSWFGIGRAGRQAQRLTQGFDGSDTISHRPRLPASQIVGLPTARVDAVSGPFHPPQFPSAPRA